MIQLFSTLGKLIVVEGRVGTGNLELVYIFYPKLGNMITF